MTQKIGIHVSGADGMLGDSIVKGLLEMPKLYPRLQNSNFQVYAGVHHETEQPSTNALVVKVDPVNNPDSAIHALKQASKLFLLIDPLSGEIRQKDALAFAKGYINAAKQANIEHIVFPTPFSKYEAPYSPPLTPVDDDNEERTNMRSYREQFEAIESTLLESFSRSEITILRYPGVLNQHLLYFANYITEKSKMPLIDNSYMTFECCDISDVVRASCRILVSPIQSHGGKEYKITGPNLLTTDEIAIKASLGLKREIKVEFMSIKQLKNVLMETTSDEEEVAYLLELWGLQGYLGTARKVQVTRDLEQITGSTGKSLREFFENSYDDFTSPQTG
ncbi:unnamed protein product [Rhizophagus irregularis]|uniref:NAD(P)-binding protein n=1 Tax=Rhizophagus irregularis TaxID=588596 RepID=A0A2I1GP44_9GLOM|nr:NAD(P)-binding protein [Rhizophagus irregularis]CAB4407527.1 unnamed protein product [Rhizophagus irregularis]